MALTKDHLEQLRQFIERTKQINTDLILGIVPNLIRNSPKFFGGERKKNFFYRQAELVEDYDRWNILARFMALTALVYSIDRRRGEKYIQFVESFIAWLRSTNENAKLPAPTFFEFAEKQTALQSKRLTAASKGDKQTAREVSAEIRATENFAPMFFKKVLPVKKSRKVKSKCRTNAKNAGKKSSGSRTAKRKSATR